MFPVLLLLPFTRYQRTIHIAFCPRECIPGGGLLPASRPHYTFSLCSHPTLWRPEYGSYMIEGTPGQPYGGTMSEFNTVEGNMGKRRREASSVLNQNQTLCTITSFPMYSRLHAATILLIPPLLLLCRDKWQGDIFFDRLTVT